MIFFLATLIGGAAAQNVLVVYAQDPYGQTQQLAESIGAGAAGAQVKILPVESVNYKRDVAEWADALFLGSGVYNGNAKPELLAFINSFDFEDDLSGMLGGSFATGGAAGAGLQPVIEQLNRALMGFRVMVVGGDSWQNGEGTAVVTNNSAPLDASALELGRAHGARMARQAAAMRRGAASPPPPPGPSGGGGGGGGKGMPPRWGDLWEAKISANLTQVGYDAGLVIVNFSTACGDEPAKQKMKTVYGDFYTVLTRCDLGYEFTIAPASRGGACTHRRIGLDVDGRICQACGCPFCTRDTNGSYTHGIHADSSTQWQPPTTVAIGGESLQLWRGVAASTDASSGAANYALSTSLAFRSDGTPVYVNVTHPLWVQTAAVVEHFSRAVPADRFDIPDQCMASVADGVVEVGVARA